MYTHHSKAFTLIELSIVLVIIGLIVGGVLVGRDLITSAAARSQISQIERFHQAVNTFRGKYGWMPGDIPSVTATGMGFDRSSATGCQYPVDGCGNGDGKVGNFLSGDNNQFGEAHLFWLDLQRDHLTDYSTIAAVPDFNTPYSQVGDYLPASPLGGGMYVYVWYGGVLNNYLSDPDVDGDGLNYYSVSQVSAFQGYMGLNTSAVIKVNTAYNIDKKIDDGLPQSGAVKAMYIAYLTGGSLKALWSAGSNVTVELGNPPDTSARAGSATTCYDNGNVNGAAMAYSLGQNNGNGANCSLSFRFQ